MSQLAVGTESNVTVLSRPCNYASVVPHRRLTDRQAIACAALLEGHRHGVPLKQRQIGALVKLVEASPSIQGGAA